MNSNYFLAKIPNMRVMREFWVRKGNYYCPPLRDINNAFVRLVLCGEKKLMKTKDVMWIEEVPNWREFSTKRVW